MFAELKADLSSEKQSAKKYAKYMQIQMKPNWLFSKLRPGSEEVLLEAQLQLWPKATHHTSKVQAKRFSSQRLFPDE